MNENNGDVIYKEIYKLMGYLSAESSEAKNIKAQLRHASSMMPGENPMLWGWLLTNMDQSLQADGGNISYAEYAVYVTLSMYAIGSGNDEHNTIAEAAALADLKRQKLAAAETASDMKEMQTALRGIIKLIASKGFAFNYGKLAVDLYSWQFNKTNIARKWEREYARKEKK